MRPDVFIIGGGPAGLAAAIAIRQKGLEVAVADCAVPPIDKACGEGLMPDSLTALEALGVIVPACELTPMRGICFIDHGHRVGAEFPCGPGAAIRRTVLHRLLAARAQELGATLIWGAKRASIQGGNAMLNGAPISCRFIVGADGSNSLVRLHSGLNATWYESRRFGFRQHFRGQPWADHVEVYWGRGRQLFVAPTGSDEIGVAMLSHDPRARLADALHEFPTVRKRLASRQPTSTERGAITGFRRLKRVTRGNVALVGDASGSVDSVTGEGMCLAFKQANALAQSLASGSLCEYEKLHLAINRRARMMARLMMLLAGHERLRRRVLDGFEREPQMLSKLVAIHIGAAPLHSLLTEDPYSLLRSLDAFLRGLRRDGASNDLPSTSC